MSIMMIKLINGEEAVGDVTNGEGEITIENALALMPTEQGFRFIPWPFFAQKNSATIRKDHVLMKFIPKAEIYNAYKEQTSSIVTAPASALDNKGKIVGV